MTLQIAVPAYGGSVRHECMASVTALGWALRGSALTTLDRHDISVARDVMAAEFLATQHSHLLFVDSDTQFNPTTVVKMQKLDVPIIGGIYRTKTAEIDFAVRNKPRNMRPDGLCEVDGVGMGLCLIRREVFAKLLATGKIGTITRGLHGLAPGTAHRFFAPIGELSEDYSFCERWRTLCGGTVHALAGENIGHIGAMTFRGNYMDHVKSSP